MKDNQSNQQNTEVYDYSIYDKEEIRMLESFEQRMINEILEWEAWIREENTNEA
ncbi:MAG: hypothetical protein ACRC17_11060 [Culicoidibacterales bacterium]